ESPGRGPSGATNGGKGTMKIEVHYYAMLREQAGRERETVETDARAPGALYDELRERHGFTPPAENIKVGINHSMGDWSQPLQEGDVVIFIPPVAGG
ncbi:MAG: MoaD/ThiS family protein, partial [Verrucomicrobiota bacterium]